MWVCRQGQGGSSWWIVAARRASRAASRGASCCVRYCARQRQLHHHFEKSGWKETQVVVRFWIITMLLCLVGLSTLKLR